MCQGILLGHNNLLLAGRDVTTSQSASSQSAHAVLTDRGGSGGGRPKRLRLNISPIDVSRSGTAMGFRHWLLLLPALLAVASANVHGGSQVSSIRATTGLMASQQHSEHTPWNIMAGCGCFGGERLGPPVDQPLMICAWPHPGCLLTPATASCWWLLWATRTC